MNLKKIIKEEIFDWVGDISSVPESPEDMLHPGAVFINAHGIKMTVLDVEQGYSVTTLDGNNGEHYTVGYDVILGNIERGFWKYSPQYSVVKEDFDWVGGIGSRDVNSGYLNYGDMFKYYTFEYEEWLILKYVERTEHDPEDLTLYTFEVVEFVGERREDDVIPDEFTRTLTLLKRDLRIGRLVFIEPGSVTEDFDWADDVNTYDHLISGNEVYIDIRGFNGENFINLQKFLFSQGLQWGSGNTELKKSDPNYLGIVGVTIRRYVGGGSFFTTSMRHKPDYAYFDYVDGFELLRHYRESMNGDL